MVDPTFVYPPSTEADAKPSYSFNCIAYGFERLP